MNYYDYGKVIDIVNREQKNGATSIYIGTLSDWFWTAEKLWTKENGFEFDIKYKPEIAGIKGSSWDEPVLKIQYDNGKYKDFSITTEIKPDDQIILKDVK